MAPSQAFVRSSGGTGKGANAKALGFWVKTVTIWCNEAESQCKRQMDVSQQSKVQLEILGGGTLEERGMKGIRSMTKPHQPTDKQAGSPASQSGMTQSWWQRTQPLPVGYQREGSL